MHFVTGGAFNGKKQWVIKNYKLDQTPHQWHCFYENKQKPELREEIVVLEGIEQYVRKLVEQSSSASKARELFGEQLSSWKKEARTLIVIGTDITKGIVPINAFDRFFRDAAGWCFQDIAEAAEKVDIIWYGIAQTIKEES